MQSDARRHIKSPGPELKSHCGNSKAVQLDAPVIVCKIMYMSIITLPIGKGRNQLCSLVPKIKAGAQVILTSHGEPQVIISAYRPARKRWRVEVPDDPARYGDLQSPVMEEWT